MNIDKEEIEILEKAANLLSNNIYFDDELNYYIERKTGFSAISIATFLREISMLCKFSKKEVVFLECFNAMEKILNEKNVYNYSWELIYDEIFSKRISVPMFKSGLMPDYYDPDTSCEEDVMAFYSAAHEKAQEIKSR